MSEQEKEECCLVCGKQLIDEKIPLCLRCKLEGRDKAKAIGEIVGGMGLAILGGVALVDSSKNNNV